MKIVCAGKLNIKSAMASTAWFRSAPRANRHAGCERTHPRHRTDRETCRRAGAGDRRRGANATAEALELHKIAKDVGAAAALSVNPYYNKPTQEGLYRHFATLADRVHLPIMLYNVPGRTAVTMSASTDHRPDTVGSGIGRMVHGRGF